MKNKTNLKTKNPAAIAGTGERVRQAAGFAPYKL
jgi:hypothetical protein